ncbi:MAG: hypothetical protein AAGE01_25715 [Pseudomonadota bacterium]
MRPVYRSCLLVLFISFSAFGHGGYVSRPGSTVDPELSTATHRASLIAIGTFGAAAFDADMDPLADVELVLSVSELLYSESGDCEPSLQVSIAYPLGLVAKDAWTPNFRARQQSVLDDAASTARAYMNSGAARRGETPSPRTSADLESAAERSTAAAGYLTDRRWLNYSRDGVILGERYVVYLKKETSGGYSVNSRFGVRAIDRDSRAEIAQSIAEFAQARYACISE